MDIVRTTRVIIALAAVATCISNDAMAIPCPASYYIDEPGDYDKNEPHCPNNPITFAKTASFESALVADSWTGVRYWGASAWPEDFRDSMVPSPWGDGGQDLTYSDAHNLSVYYGHGGYATLIFSHVHYLHCDVDGQGIRLGTMSGDMSAIAIFQSCCTLNVNYLAWFFPDQTHEILGQHAVASIGSNDLATFYSSTNTLSNFDSWLENLDGGNNMPMAVSFGVTPSNATQKAAICKLKAGTCLDKAPENQNYYYYQYIDKGATGC